jgi:nicotinamidase-related amidase
MGTLKAALGAKAVHLCIDMQRLFAEGGPWAAPWMERVLPTVVSLVERAPARTVFTRFIPPQSADDAPGMWRAYYQKWPNVTRMCVDAALLELTPALQKFTPPARVFDKGVYSAFATGELHPFLRQHSTSTLVITGSETDVCVLSTVLAAVDLGYRVVVVRDAVCSSSDESHDALIDLYSLRFDVQIELTTTDEVLAQWHL